MPLVPSDGTHRPDPGSFGRVQTLVDKPVPDRDSRSPIALYTHQIGQSTEDISRVGFPQTFTFPRPLRPQLSPVLFVSISMRNGLVSWPCFQDVNRLAKIFTQAESCFTK